MHKDIDLCFIYVLNEEPTGKPEELDISIDEQVHYFFRVKVYEDIGIDGIYSEYLAKKYIHEFSDCITFSREVGKFDYDVIVDKIKDKVSRETIFGVKDIEILHLNRIT